MSEEKSFLSTLKEYRKEIIVGFLIILLLVFMIQNSHDVDFNLIVTDMDIPLIVLILGFSSLGAIIVGVYWYINNRDKKREKKELEKEVDSLKERITQLEKSDHGTRPS